MSKYGDFWDTLKNMLPSKESMHEANKSVNDVSHGLIGPKTCGPESEILLDSARANAQIGNDIFFGGADTSPGSDFVAGAFSWLAAKQMKEVDQMCSGPSGHGRGTSGALSSSPKTE